MMVTLIMMVVVDRFEAATSSFVGSYLYRTKKIDMHKFAPCKYVTNI